MLKRLYPHLVDDDVFVRMFVDEMHLIGVTVAGVGTADLRQPWIDQLVDELLGRAGFMS